jgi:myo-inositol 2-dehydrogenase/D-chiro-inositol 1-dehydrogenase
MSARVAFIGCGSHATNNIFPMLKYARCRLDSVCDLNEELARRNAQIFGAEAAYTDVRRLLDEREVDGIFVVGPPSMHHEVGKLVLERGLPLFVEKPPAPSLVQTQELVDIARQHGTWFMTGFMKRFGMTYRKAQELMTAGHFVPAAMRLQYGHWRSTDLRSMLLYMSSHPLDLAMAFFGPVHSLHSTIYRDSRQSISLAVTLRFASGRWAQLMLDGSQPRIQERVEISGTMDGNNALLVMDNVEHLELHRQKHNGVDLLAPTLDAVQPQFELSDIQVWRPDHGLPNMGQTRHFNQGFAGEVREFINAILEKRRAVPGAVESLAVMRLIEAIAAKPDGETMFDGSLPSGVDQPLKTNVQTQTQ